MSALRVLNPLTYDDLLAMPDDGQRHEILHGELIVTASPTPPNVVVGTRIATRLAMFVETHDLGTFFGSEVDVRLSPYDIVAPDLCFVSLERDEIVTEQLIDGAPDLVIEVLSPSTRRYDLVSKLALYATGGVQEYWIVDPATSSIRVLAFEGGRAVEVPQPGDRVRSRLFSELELKLAEIFR
jgi:Uma2 family endonuclease